MASSSDQDSHFFEMRSCPDTQPGMARRGDPEYQCRRDDAGLFRFKGNSTVFNGGDFVLSAEPGFVFSNP